VAGLVYTGAVEDYFFLVEAELTRRLGPDVAGALHTARSRNDIDHTVFKLTLRPRVAALTEAATGLARALLDTAAREATTPIVAYTHGHLPLISHRAQSIALTPVINIPERPWRFSRTIWSNKASVARGSRPNKKGRNS
jgi:argininosuccinate lyase